nr:type VI secretion system protein TssA [uncultured Pseudomonas sp.]
MTEVWVSDLDSLAGPVSAESPCGDSIEYEPDYLELEEEARGKPEVEYGNTLTQAVTPDWKRIKRLALPLAARSRDLRLALYLTRAELNLEGIPGFVAGLRLVETLVRDHWDHVHPQLDAEDDNDPQLRVNILASLCEPGGLIQDLREAPLVDVPALGRVSLRDVDLAAGQLAVAPDEEKPSLAMIEAAFQEGGHVRLSTILVSLHQAIRSSECIETTLTQRVGFGSAIDLSALSAMLQRAADVVRQRLPQQVNSEAGGAVTPPSATTAANQGEIASRDDVRQALDRLCVYFAIHEPTSPVPLLLQRARKMLDLGFMELLHELAPDGVAQMALISGSRNDG